MTFPQGVKPEIMLVEFHPVRHVDFDLTVTVPPANISLVQVNGTNNNPVSSLAVAFTNPTALNNLLIAAVGAVSLDGSTNTATMSDTQTNSWSQIGAYVTATPGGYGIVNFMALSAGGADTVTVTFNNTLGFARLIIHEVKGVSILDQHKTASGNTYPLDSGAMTTTAANEFVYAWGVADNGTTVPGAGYTIARTQSIESTEYQIVNSVGAYHATFPGDGANSDWEISAATFK